MPIVKFRLGWGAVEFEASTDAADGPGTGVLFDQSVNYTPGPPLGMRKLVLEWLRTGALAAEDRVLIDLTWMNYTSGAADDSWVDADYAAVETACNTWWTAVKSLFASTYTFNGGRWYKVVAPGVASPALRLYSTSSAGTSAGGALPPQVALSVTLKTPIRKRWGRVYLPGISQSNLDTAGRPTSGCLTTLVTPTATLLTSSIASQGIYPVVFSRVMQAGYSVTTVQIDNTFDVIRSRRYAAPSTRSSVAL